MLDKRKIRTKCTNFSSVHSNLYINKNAYIHPEEVFINKAGHVFMSLDFIYYTKSPSVFLWLP